MAVRRENGDSPESRFNPNSPIGFFGLSDLDAGSMRVVRRDPSVRKRYKAADKIVCAVCRDINPIFWNCSQGFVRGSGCMPIELHIHAARPLNNGISSYRIVERSDENVGPCAMGSADGSVEIRHQITSPLNAERIGHRCLEAED